MSKKNTTELSKYVRKLKNKKILISNYFVYTEKS